MGTVPTPAAFFLAAYCVAEFGLDSLHVSLTTPCLYGSAGYPD